MKGEEILARIKFEKENAGKWVKGRLTGITKKKPPIKRVENKSKRKQ